MAETVKSGLIFCSKFTEVLVETHYSHSHNFKLSIIGLPDTSVKESKDRIISAFRALGIKLTGELIVNLSPSDLKKDGTALDLPIAVSLLNKIKGNLEEEIFDSVLLGELGLDGSVKACNSVLLVFVAAFLSNKRKFILPDSFRKEISSLPIKDCDIWFINNLKELFQTPKFECVSYSGSVEYSPHEQFKLLASMSPLVQHAVILSLVGGHSMLLIGPPGQGKTFTANLISKLLPPLNSNEILENYLYYSLAGEDYSSILKGSRPFRSPHHSATKAAMIGGGVKGRPGEATLANNGVLFLDELGEFNRSTLDSLRVPIETKKVKLARANYVVDLPADFLLICATNPCPCGYFGSRKNSCRCSFTEVKKYLSKFSGPFLERIDIHVFVDGDGFKNDCSLRFDFERILECRQAQIEKFGDLIAKLDGKFVLDYCRNIIPKVISLTTSTRSLIKCLKLALTNSFLDGRVSLNEEDFYTVKKFRRLENILEPFSVK